MPRFSKALINLDAIIANYKLAISYAPHSKNIAVIKADAYGHGSLQVAQALQKYVPAFAVAIFEEAKYLRDNGIKKPILVLQGVNDTSELEYAASNNIWLAIQNKQQLNSLLDKALVKAVNIWLKVDTGMHRLGFQGRDIANAYNKLASCQWVEEKIVMFSHLSCASTPSNEDNIRTIEDFEKICNELREKNHKMAASLANSAAILAQPKSLLNWNRPGIMLYGASPFDDELLPEKKLQPAMTLLSSVIAIREVRTGENIGYSKNWQAEKDSIIATVAIGYADGYPRHAVNGTPVLVEGQKALLVGNVSMDMMSIDITKCQNVKIGSVVELWGENIAVDLVAQCANTIGYELVSRVSKRIPRCYSIKH